MYVRLGGGSSCTSETSYAVGKWLGSGIDFTVVDTPGFQDTDQAKLSFFNYCNVRIGTGYKCKNQKYLSEKVKRHSHLNNRVNSL